MEGKSKYAVIMQFWYNISESLETQIGKGAYHWCISNPMKWDMHVVLKLKNIWKKYDQNDPQIAIQLRTEGM